MVDHSVTNHTSRDTQICFGIPGGRLVVQRIEWYIDSHLLYYCTVRVQILTWDILRSGVLVGKNRVTDGSPMRLFLMFFFVCFFRSEMLKCVNN